MTKQKPQTTLTINNKTSYLEDKITPTDNKTKIGYPKKTHRTQNLHHNPTQKQQQQYQPTIN
jgi:hypothetical protein